MRMKLVFGLGLAATLMLCVFTAPVSGQPALPDKAKDWEYVGNTQCKVCHNSEKEGGQWGKWKAEKHSQAFELLKSDEAKKVAEAKGLTVPAHEAPECLRCHVTGYDAAAKAAPAKIKMEDGIQCESCHGPSSMHTKDGQKLKFKPELITEMDVMANKVHPGEETCKGCHNAESPTWKEDRYTTESGEKTGFDFKQAWEKINHAFPAGAMEEKYGGKYPVD